MVFHPRGGRWGANRHRAKVAQESSVVICNGVIRCFSGCRPLAFCVGRFGWLAIARPLIHISYALHGYCVTNRGSVVRCRYQKRSLRVAKQHPQLGSRQVRCPPHLASKLHTGLLELSPGTRGWCGDRKRN